MAWVAGTFSRALGANQWANDAAAAVGIQAGIHDTADNDLATAGINECLNKAGQNSPTANIPMGGFKLTGLGSGVARTDSATIGNLQDGSTNYVGTSGGTPNAITITASPAITAYITGQRFLFGAVSANTGATTLSINGLTAIAVVKTTGISGAGLTALTGGEIVNDGGLVHVIYNGTNFTLLNPSISSYQSWTPTFTGFAGAPVVGARYSVQNKQVVCHFFNAISGVSNATGFTISAPLPAKVIAGGTWGGVCYLAIDNGANLANAARATVTIASGASTINVLLDNNAAGWTAANGKGVSFTLIYETV